MSDKHRRHHERGQRVRLHMTTSETDFPPGSKPFILANDLEGMLADADAHEVTRVDNKRKRKQGTEARDAARTALRRMLKTTSDTAEPLTLDHPEMKGVFNPQIRKDNDQDLIAAARSAANAAAQYAAFFTESGLPPAFFDQMRAKADDIEIAIAQQTEAVNAGVRATAALEDLYRRMDELIDRLDPIVRNKYAGDPAKLAAWESASRLERAPRHGDDNDDDTNTNNNPNTPPPPTNP
ncbi:MAG TPA: hypothetical protein VJ866_00915 [Pyrinomonadaceae bacterium]|nr:hypothetical protein [Pyrinomonadaceae bacterium]